MEDIGGSPTAGRCQWPSPAWCRRRISATPDVCPAIPMGVSGYALLAQEPHFPQLLFIAPIRKDNNRAGARSTSLGRTAKARIQYPAKISAGDEPEIDQREGTSRS